MVALAPSHKDQLCNYTTWLTKRNIPYRVLSEKDTMKNFSMLVLCGGPDFGTAGKRDELEIRWLKESYGKVPVLGICRGLQLSNIVLGGTLYEDLASDKVKHSSNRTQVSGEPKPVLESSWHNIVFEDGKKVRVNSRHHQGINLVAPEFKVVARCEDDGLPEMLMGNNSLFVQWHPERSDVWGTEAEEIVYEWMRDRVTHTEPLQQIFEYMESKNFTVVSNERVRKSINENFSDKFLHELVEKNRGTLKRVVDKKGRTALKKLH